MQKKVVLAVILCLFLSGCDSTNFYLIPLKRYTIPQNGMFPNLPAKSTFWIKRKPLININKIERGDIATYNVTQNGDKYIYVWRVVGLSGDDIAINSESLSINGKKLNHTVVKEDLEHIFIQEENGKATYTVVYKKVFDPKKRPNITIKIPENFIFLMGDNRDSAYDNRFTGPISLKEVEGILF